MIRLKFNTTRNNSFIYRENIRSNCVGHRWHLSVPVLISFQSYEYFERINMNHNFTVAKKLCLFSIIIFMQIWTDSAWNLVKITADFNLDKFQFSKKKFFTYFLCIFKRPKDLKVENVKQCLDFVSKDSPIVVDVFDITQRERQKWALNSTVRILSDIATHIYVSRSIKFYLYKNSGYESEYNFIFQFKMNVTRCSFSRFKCEDIETVATPNVCDKINSPNTVWAPVVDMVQPRLKCPIKTVNG